MEAKGSKWKQRKHMEAGAYQNSRQVLHCWNRGSYFFLCRQVIQQFSESGIYWKQRSSTDAKTEMLAKTVVERQP